MIKVGIMSMQRIFNYGSFLQAYGLKQLLEEQGAHVEFVDYHPGEVLVKNSSDSKKTSGVFGKVFQALSYRAPFGSKIKFALFKAGFANKYFKYLGVTEEKNYYPKLDLLVIGSDEVFNCVQSNSNVGFSLDLFGFGNRANRLISYAASFGNTTLSKLQDYQIDESVKDMFTKFDMISVRDTNSSSIVYTLTGQKPVINLDPVLAFDYVNECSLIPEHIKAKKYMVLYGYSGRFTHEECAVIQQFATQHKLNILCIGGVQECCDSFISCSPFEVIAYFRDAQFVVTDTFHGSIISIITHSRFAAIIRESGYGNSEKMNDLLSRLKLTDRKVKDINSLPELLTTSIDFSDTENVLKQGRADTKVYLKEQLLQSNN